jgi:FHS family L-fucose permease-like MFS transporter
LFTTEQGHNLLVTFCLVSSLFLLWGFCNGLIDVMDKHFQEALHLSLSESAWVQFAHYLGYFLMALPAGVLTQRLGYKVGIITGLLIVAAGGLWFLVATQIATFWAFLLGVCIIASGLTFLETIANPYATVLGDERYAALRINLAQSCNGIGWIFGPIAASIFFYPVGNQVRATGNDTLYIPYLGVAAVVLVLVGAFSLAYVPDIKTRDEYGLDQPDTVASDTGLSRALTHSIWKRPHFVMAVAAQFLYVAAQASIFSFFINYMTSQSPPIPESWNAGLMAYAHHAGILQTWLSGWFRRDVTGALSVSDRGAANFASLAFVCFLLGRAAGTGLIRRVAANRLLALYGSINVIVTLLVICRLGWVSVASVFLSYFFMSIMFPTIFALGIHGLGSKAKHASAYLVMAIVGGALLPKLMGYIADRYDISRSFIVPMACFGFIAYYGLRWPQLSKGPVNSDSARS